jgi:hypothetical protein
MNLEMCDRMAISLIKSNVASTYPLFLDRATSLVSFKYSWILPVLRASVIALV